MLLEHIIMCRLVMGNKTLALQEISTAITLCKQQPQLLETHAPQLHTLLGLYSMSMNCMEAAEKQFLATISVCKYLSCIICYFHSYNFRHPRRENYGHLQI